MTEFFKFASENPWLTFFLFAIVAEMIYRTAYALGPKLCKKCNKAVGDDD